MSTKFTLVKKWLLIVSLTLLSGLTLKAQSWKTLGGTREFAQPFSSGGGYNTSMARDANGNLYVAFRDGSNSDKLTVKKFTASNSTWATVGSAGISAGAALYTSLVVDGSNLYVAYGDDTKGGRVTAQKWDGTRWDTLGTTGFTTTPAFFVSIVRNATTGNLYVVYQKDWGGAFFVYECNVSTGNTWSALSGSPTNAATFPSMAIDPSGNLFVAYNSAGTPLFNKLAIQKWTHSSRTWANYIGSATTGSAIDHPSIVADVSGNIYVACNERTPAKLSVYKCAVVASGTTTLVSIGSNISAGLGYFSSMGLDGSNNLYVAYQDGGNSKKLTVQKYNGSTWAVAGKVGISAGAVSEHYTSTVVDATGNVYVAYQDGSIGNKTIVQKLTVSGWSVLGTNISAGEVRYNSTVRDSQGNVYVAYTDVGNGNKLSVKKFTASTNTWATVGSAGISGDTATYNSMVIDGTGNLYVAYQDSMGGKLTVQKFTASTNTWAVVGSAGISSGTALYNSMAIDGTGNLYVAYQDSIVGKLTVQKFTSASGWAVLGSAGISAGAATYNSMAIDATGNVYVAYADGGNANKLTIHKWGGSSWAVVGSAGISASGVESISMVIDGTGNLYVACTDAAASNKLTVYKWNGTALSPLGGATGISAGAVAFNSLVLDASGNLYVAYQDYTNSKLTVQKWNGTAWSYLGATAGISGTFAFYNSMVLDASGNLYVAYSDNGNGNKLSVQKFIATATWADLGSSGISAATAEHASMVRDASNNLYVAYADGSKSNKLSVQKFTASTNTWDAIGSGISAGAASFTSMVLDGSNLYVAYADGNKSNKVTVQKWDGTKWDTLGPTGFSGSNAVFISMVKDASGNLFVAYQQNYEPLEVYKWTAGGTTWSSIGGVTSKAHHPSMAVDANGNLYVAYNDDLADAGGIRNKLTIKKWTKSGSGGSWGDVSLRFGTVQIDFPSIVVDGSGNIYVAYHSRGNTKLNVHKFQTVGGNGVSQLGNGISAGSAKYSSIALDASNNLYVAYQDGGNGNKLTVQKYNGTSWSVVGKVGISAGAVPDNRTAIAVDGSGNLYTAYTSGSLFAQAYNIGNFYSTATGVQASNVVNWNSTTTNTGAPATSFNSGDNFVVQANHTVTNTGTINFGTGNLVVNATGNFVDSGTTSLDTLTINSGATATLTGNLQVAGSITNNGGTLNATAGTVTYNGTAVQTIAANTFSSNTVKNLTINNAAGVLLSDTLKLTGVLTPTAGIFYTGGKLVLTSTTITGGGAIAQGSSGGGYIRGNVTVQRYTQAQRGYRTIAHPYKNAQSLEQLTKTFSVTGLTTNAGTGTYASATGGASAFWHDANQLAGATSVLQPITDATATTNWGVGKALRVFVRGNANEGLDGSGIGNYSGGINPITINMTGDSVNQGDLAPVTLTYGDATTDNFNLIGNPYPCPINLKKITTTGSFGTVWVFNPVKNLGSGDPYTNSGGFDIYTNDDTNNIIIPSLGSFYVKATASGQSISFKETNKITSAATVTSSSTPRIGLAITSTTGSVDDLKFVFNAASKDSAIDTYDGAKLANDLFDLYSISADNKRLGIDYRNSTITKDTVIKLGVSTTVPKTYYCTLSELVALPNYQIILRDKLFNIEKAFTTVGDSLGFTITADDAATQGDNRFELVLRSNVVLPVTIADITAQLQTNKTVAVNWTSATEQNLAYYHVQRSKDGSNFSTVGKVAATGAGTYSFSDDLSAMQPLPTTVYYRLQSVDNNASSAYSKVVSCRLLNATQQALLIYPNPVQSTLFAQVTATKAGSVEIAVRDLQGRLLSKQISQVAAGTTAISVNTAGLATGSYVLVVTGADGTQQQQFVKQ